MRITFPDALVTEWEELVSTIHLPDPDDRRVVAALPASITRQSLDDFLLDIFDLHPGQVVPSAPSPGEPESPARG